MRRVRYCTRLTNRSRQLCFAEFPLNDLATVVRPARSVAPPAIGLAWARLRLGLLCVELLAQRMESILQIVAQALDPGGIFTLHSLAQLVQLCLDVLALGSRHLLAQLT
jgi:hypothetical protein